MADNSSSVQVEIFGQAYSVRAGTDRGYVERLAAHVDAQMREIGRSAGAVDSLRVAVLAALNIADEAFRLREEVRAMRERVARLADTLGPVEESAKKA